MDVVQLLIQNFGMILALANQTMSYWMVMPANATGPLDPNITLTDPGSTLVWQLANAAIGLSNFMAEALDLLF